MAWEATSGLAVGEESAYLERLLLTLAHGLPFAIVLSVCPVLVSRPSGGGIGCLTMGLPWQS
jgi:hypothetical protein